MGMRRLWVPIGAAVIGAGLAGCSTVSVTTAAPPTVVCGTVLTTTNAVMFDATGHLPTLTHPDIGNVLIFRVSRSCDHGARVSWTPAAAAQLVKAAYAKDHQPAAVILKPAGPNAAFRLVATRDGHVVASATVKLAG
jgi:hypothetical protein